MHDREQAADLEVGLLVDVFELNESSDRILFLEATDLESEVTDQVGFGCARYRQRRFRRDRDYVGFLVTRFGVVCLEGTVKANKYRPFSASNRTKRRANS
jgi:hypothetical protein